MADVELKDVIRVIATLPPDKMAEVYDFALFLHQRYQGEMPIDIDDAWNTEDIEDLLKFALGYANSAGWEK